MTTSLVINILADAKDAKNALRDTSKSVDDLGDSGKNMGKFIAAGAATAVAGLIALGAGALEAAQESARVGRETERVLKTTGSAAWESVSGVQALSQAISDKTGVDDEAIQSGANLILTFTNIQNKVGDGNDVFDRATAAALDMSTALGTDMSGAAIQLGKALNDPIKGITALSKAGVSFNEGQKDQIKLMVEAGDLLGAQKIILNEVEKEFKGAAEAASTPFDKLKVALGNLQEDIGAKLIGPASAAANFLLNNLNPALEATVGFLESNSGAFKVLASVGLAAATLALGHFVAAQAVAVATGFGSFISELTVAYALYTEGTLAAAAATGVFDSALIATAVSAAPLILPLVALSAAIFAVMSIMDKSSESADKFWESVHRDVDTSNLKDLADATEKVTKRQIELTRAQGEAGFGDLAKQAADLLIPFHDVENSLTDQQKEHDALAEKQKEHAAATALGTEKLSAYADAQAGVTNANRTSIPFWEDSTKLMSEAEGAAAGINDKLLAIAQSKKIELAEPGAADRVQALYERTKVLGSSTLEMTDAQKKFNDAASDAKDKVDAYKSSLDALVGVHLSAAEAETSLSQNSFSLAKTLAANEKVVTAAVEEGSLAQLQKTEAVDKNNKAVQDNVKQILEMADATFKESQQTDGSTVALGKANDVLVTQRDKLIATMVQFGYSEDAAKAYVDRLGLTPKNIDTQVNLDNHAANVAIDDTHRRLISAAGVYTATIDANTAPAEIAIRRMLDLFRNATNEAKDRALAGTRSLPPGGTAPVLVPMPMAAASTQTATAPVFNLTFNHTGLAIDSPRLQSDIMGAIRRYERRNGPR